MNAEAVGCVIQATAGSCLFVKSRSISRWRGLGCNMHPSGVWGKAPSSSPSNFYLTFRSALMIYSFYSNSPSLAEKERFDFACGQRLFAALTAHCAVIHPRSVQISPLKKKAPIWDASFLAEKERFELREKHEIWQC